MGYWNTLNVWGQGISRGLGHSNQYVGVLGMSVYVKISRAPCKQIGWGSGRRWVHFMRE